MDTMAPSCVALYTRGVLRQRAEKAARMLSRCVLCPRRCKVDRLAGEPGACATGKFARVASYGPHFGEEQPLVGTRGSGTIFLASCNLRCCFCQNYDISHDPGAGEEVDDRDLAAIMLDLQNRGCHNINLVSPSHVVPQLLGALVWAVEEGLSVPVVYNCGGYESLLTLEMLDGVVDIYMPDFKFWNPESARRYIDARDYPKRAKAALLLMHRQVGDLRLDSSGMAMSGLLLRHLLMPGLLEETGKILAFIGKKLSQDTYVNLMDQYRPCGMAHRFPELGRTVSPAEVREAFSIAREVGLRRLDQLDIGTILQKLELLSPKPD